MTQRIFDIYNEKDYADLWDILPEEIYEIRKGYGDSIEDNTFFFKKGHTSTFLLNINWHDKTEITRPVNYKDMIGCIGWFHDGEEVDKKHDTMGILRYYDSTHVHPFVDDIFESNWKYFTPAKKSELKFYGEDK